MAINWFPGHMAKTRRLITEHIRQVDIVVELADARLPESSRNPILPELLGDKKRLLVLNKSDMADPAANEKWKSWYEKQGQPTLLCDSVSGKGVRQIPDKLREMLADKIRCDAEKGMTRAIKIMVVGVPNVGKSSLINKLSGRKAAKVEDRPGVTRDKQWIRLDNGIELLDTPGILWPKFEDQEVGYRLAYSGAIRDQVVDVEEVACRLLKHLAGSYPIQLAERYKLAVEPQELDRLEGWEILELVGRKRGFLISGGEVNYERTSNMVLDEFREVKIGRITLEWPGQTNQE
ncbi:MAG: ribosome biogenesis GTPase YlqF [Eubacteriales bacterium]|jgi:ribosome biogenesis GTPase A